MANVVSSCSFENCAQQSRNAALFPTRLYRPTHHALVSQHDFFTLVRKTLPLFRKTESCCCLSPSLFVQLIHMTAAAAVSCLLQERAASYTICSVAVVMAVVQHTHPYAWRSANQLESRGTETPP